MRTTIIRTSLQLSATDLPINVAPQGSVVVLQDYQEGRYCSILVVGRKHLKRVRAWVALMEERELYWEAFIEASRKIKEEAVEVTLPCPKCGEVHQFNYIPEEGWLCFECSILEDVYFEA